MKCYFWHLNKWSGYQNLKKWQWVVIVNNSFLLVKYTQKYSYCTLFKYTEIAFWVIERTTSIYIFHKVKQTKPTDDSYTISDNFPDNQSVYYVCQTNWN